MLDFSFLHLALQMFYWIVFAVISLYFHEFGHYAVNRYYYPKAECIEFAWSTFFFIPIPHRVISRNLNGVVTVRKAIIAFIAGPILGFIPIIASYYILDLYLFVWLVAGGLLGCKSDFKKIYITFKGWQQGEYD